MPECTPGVLLELAKCFVGLSIPQLEAIKAYLLAISAGVEPDLSDLMDGSKCFQGLSEPQLKAIQTYLLCQIANATPAPPGETDGLIWGPAPETAAQFDGGLNSYLSLINSSTGETYTTISVGNPTHVTGAVSWNGYGGTGLTFRLLETIGSSLSVNGGGVSVLDTLIFESLVSVGTDVDLGDNPSLVTLGLDQLVSIGGQLYVDNNSSQTTLSLPALTSVNSISIQGAAPILSAPSLTTYPTLGITADATLLTLNLPACTDDGAGQLNTDLQNMTSLVTLNLNALTAITNELNLQLLTSLAVINLTSLVTVGQDVDFSNTALVSISLPALTAITTNLQASPVATLTSFSAPLWVVTDGTTINFNGCSLDIPSVENILRRCVLAGVTTCTIDLSGGTNAGTASLSAQGQADVATLGAQVTMNP